MEGGGCAWRRCGILRESACPIARMLVGHGALDAPWMVCYAPASSQPQSGHLAVHTVHSVLLLQVSDR